MFSSKPSTKERKTWTSWMTWGWVNDQEMFIWKWTLITAVTDLCRSGAVAACAGPLEASVLYRDPSLQPRRPADGVRGRGRGVPGHPHHRQHGGARHEGEGHHRWRMWSALAWVLCVYQVCPMLMFLCAHSCRRRSGQGCCQRRHGQQSGHVSAGHRCQASRGTVLRGGAQHVLRSESGERSRHRDRGASSWGAHQHQWSSCSRSW